MGIRITPLRKSKRSPEGYPWFPDVYPVYSVFILGSLMEERKAVPTRLGRAWHWLKNQIVQDVPEDIALCEFGCRNEQCTIGEWENCERRIEGAAGELTPQRPEPAAESVKRK